MSTLEGARAAAHELDKWVDACDIWLAWTLMASGRDALRALIAEHERLAADLELYQEHAGLTFPRPLKVEPVTDEQIEAAQDAFHEFVFGPREQPLSPRERGITRQAWRVALEAARGV